MIRIATSALIIRCVTGIFYLLEGSCEAAIIIQTLRLR